MAGFKGEWLQAALVLMGTVHWTWAPGSPISQGSLDLLVFKYRKLASPTGVSTHGLCGTWVRQWVQLTLAPLRFP